jgi:hypothetical protein
LSYSKQNYLFRNLPDVKRCPVTFAAWVCAEYSPVMAEYTGPPIFHLSLSLDPLRTPQYPQSPNHNLYVTHSCVTVTVSANPRVGVKWGGFKSVVMLTDAFKYHLWESAEMA